ncbi:YfhO family protein [Lentilactobacillus sp. SPB1-3]|uniref:YfhO family protein n=1 Tax=Lentilactobacillus terminaliae TaxID=3003483 RepID=A0ACD5DEB0_9LACO|nr:YfhO family protein [Lentilactobacillus sp. SPB1-3]MCZ0977613.1 YfhO family protein [Lentilactobacillus sp. SPB1-3]
MKTIWKKTPTFILYTLFFLIFVCVMISCLSLSDKSMIWQLDGLAQHFPILIQFRQMILEFIAHPTHGLTNWAWNIGLGSDTLTNFQYYVIGDLFNYLIVLFPKSQIETGFGILVFLRMYVSGLSFLLFTHHYNFKKISKLIGALAYTFNGYAIATGLHHPFFILPLIFFPLLAYGIDNVLKNKSFVPLVIAVFLVLIGNFYFAWILAIGAIVYTLIRLLSMRKVAEFKFFKSVGKLIGSAIIGLGMATLVFLPTIMLAAKSTRINQKFANGLTFFPLEYYLKIPSTFLVNGRAMNFWLVIGITSFSFLAIVYMVSHFKKYLWANIYLLIVIVGLLIPAFGAIINAMTTPSNRWILLANLLFAFATMILIDNMNSLTKRDLYWMFGSSLGLIFIVWLNNGMILNLARHDFIEYGMLLLTMTVILAMLFFHWSHTTNFVVITLIFSLNLMANIVGVYSPNSSNLANQQMDQGISTRFSDDYYNGAQNYVKQQPGFFRTSKAPRYQYNQKIDNLANFTNTNTNIAINTGINDESIYLTLQNGYLGDFSRAVANSQFSMNTPIGQNDYRTALNDLMGVKYLFARANTKNQMIPYGYTPVKDKNGKIKIFQAKSRINADPSIENSYGTVVYKNKNALPLVYSQSKTVSPSAFNQLDPLDKERVMTQGAVVNKSSQSRSPLNYNSPRKNIKYQVNIDSTDLLDSTSQLAKYRLNILGKSNADKLLKQPHQQISLGANEQKVQNILLQNKNILENNAYRNRNGLKDMTTDATGKPLQYSLKVNNPNATKNSELFLVINGIKQTDGSLDDQMDWITNQNLLDNKSYSKLQKMNDYRSNLLNPKFGGYLFNAFTKNYQTGFAQYDSDNLSNYRQINSIVLNLGYSKDARKNVKLVFNQVKNIKFSSVKLVAMPFDKQYDRQIQQLKNSGLTNLKVNKSHVSGISNSQTKQTLVSSIPYSTGWHLKIDGKASNTFVVNKGFVGANVPAGRHKIQLTYQTPGYNLGVLITIISTIILIILWVISVITSRNHRDKARHSKAH